MVAVSPQTLDLDDRRRLAAWAADCAEHVLHIYESAVPGDARVRSAISRARAFASGELTVGEAVRYRGGDAGAAAREAPTVAAKAAAHAAEQAAAVAHMGAHGLGAAGYAAKAATLAAVGGGDDATYSEVRWQIAAMSDAVADALAPGVTTDDLDQVAREVLAAAGAESNFLGYHGFPAVVCTSVNSEVVHGIPGPRVLAEGDLISVDAGAVVDGWRSRPD